MSTIKSVLVIQKNAVFWCLAFIGWVRYEELYRSRRGFYLPRPVHSTYSPGLPLGILGGGVPPSSSNPDLILDQKMCFSTPATLPPKSKPVQTWPLSSLLRLDRLPKVFLKSIWEFAYYSSFLITSAEREVKDSRRSGMYQSYHFLTRLGMQSL